MNKEYAKENLADLKERDEVDDVDEWEDLKQAIFSPEEIIASEVRATKIVNALSKTHARKKQIFKAIKFEENNYFKAMSDEKDSVGDEDVDSGRNKNSGS